MSLTAGFDIGGTEIKFGLVDKKCRVWFKGSVATPSDVKQLGETLAGIWTRMKRQAGRKKILAAGFGLPGIFSPKKEQIIQSPNYPGLDNLKLRPFLQTYFDVPFFLDNDANLAAYGEWAVGAKDKPLSLVHLTLGTGIGSGIILEGRIWHGAAGFAAEIGHVIVNPEGELCRCGNKGCLETEASGPAIVRHYRMYSGGKVFLDAKEVARLAKKGDAAARRSFSRAGYFLGIGLGIIISTLNPEIIVLGGGVMASGQLLLNPALHEARRRCFRAAYASTVIRRAVLENDAGFIGAGLIARTKLEKGSL
ncbi:MAG: ROK family protein [Candidatus Aminicenantales bacterium]